MSDPKLPLEDGNVPDKVLEELQAAFGNDSPTTAADALVTIPNPVVSPSVPTATAVDDPQRDPAAGLTTERVPTTSAEVPATATTSADTGPGNAGASDTGTSNTAARKPIQIGGGDEDYVDAVYLDEEGANRLRGDSNRSTEASVERTTILIGDDEIEGSSGGIPVATGSASMDPRLRARRVAVKRAISRRRLKWFVIGGTVIIVVTGALAVLGSSLFEVKNVYPSGVTGQTEGAYDEAVRALKGHPVMLVDTNAIESQLEKNAWVREARVSTDFPDSASIEVVERVPLATYQGNDGRWRIIDVEGAVLTVIPGQPLEFMVISGPGADAEAGGSAGDAFRHAAELVEVLSPAVRSRTERVVVSDSGELSLMFANTEVILGAPENLLDKLTRLEAVLKRAGADELIVINVATRDVSIK